MKWNFTFEPPPELPEDFEEVEVRTFLIDGEPWFLAKDMARAFRYEFTSYAMEEVKAKDSRSIEIDGFPERVVNRSGAMMMLLESEFASEYYRFDYWIKSTLAPAAVPFSVQKEDDETKSLAQGTESGEESCRTQEEAFESQEEPGLMRAFSFEGSEVRTVLIDNEPWFVGKDVAERLGYKKARNAIARHVDKEDRKNDALFRDAIGREQSMTVINVSGVFSLILRSKLTAAKKFKHWVTSEVLPALFKEGTYTMPQSSSIKDEERRAEMLLKAAELADSESREDFLGELKKILITR